MSLVCTLSFFLHILINIRRNLNIFCINVDIYEMLLLQKKKGQGINTVIVIPLCNSLMSVTLLFFLSILLNNFRNLVIFCRNVDIEKSLLLWKFFNILNRTGWGWGVGVGGGWYLISSAYSLFFHFDKHNEILVLILFFYAIIHTI